MPHADPEDRRRYHREYMREKAGVIEDDNMAVIGFPDYHWEKAKPKHGKVRVRVEGVGE